MTMKKSILLLSILIVSCKPLKMNDKEKEAWISAYKSTAFIGCLSQSFGKDFDQFLNKDQSVGANFEILYNSNMKKADSVGNNFAKSITIFPENSDFFGKKIIINNCLFFYKSKELDSIANFEYKKMLLKK